MSFLIALLAAAKGLTLITGLLAGNQSAVSVTPEKIIVAGQQVFVTVRVDNAFPPELRKLAATGTAITLYVFIELHEERERKPAASAIAESRLVFDIIENTYTVTGTPRPGERLHSSPDSAIADACLFENIPVAPVSAIRADRSYRFTLNGILGKTRVEALDNNEINLIFFWNYRRPSARTEPVAGNDLLKRKRN